jgi:hypothetical protein
MCTRPELEKKWFVLVVRKLTADISIRGIPRTLNASIAGEQFGWKKRTVEVRASTVWDIEIHPG